MQFCFFAKIYIELFENKARNFTEQLNVFVKFRAGSRVKIGGGLFIQTSVRDKEFAKRSAGCQPASV